MSDDKREQDPLREGAREAARVVGGAGRRLARGLRELTRRPDDDDDKAEGNEGEEEDLGEKVRDLGRDFLDVMGRVSVTTGKKLRRAAYDASDTVRGAFNAARADRPPADGDADADPDATPTPGPDPSDDASDSGDRRD